MFKQTKNNQQGSILILVVAILGGAVFSAVFALGVAMKFAKSSAATEDVYAAVSACAELANGYQVTGMACDTPGECIDAAGACVTCGDDEAINAIGSNCWCALEVDTAGDPKLLVSHAWCNNVYISKYVYFSSTGDAPPPPPPPM
ncbi:MAG: hypothetical protein V1865_02655 [bacterium]